jgi:Formin Homology 2 Domain
LLLRAELCYDPKNVTTAKAAHSSLKRNEVLATPDLYMVEVVDHVPNIKERLRAMTFRATFPELVSRVQTLVESFRACCGEICNSLRYRLLLTQVILPLNNLLAGVDMSGFRVTDLPKLVATKNSQGKTFLDVAVEFCLGAGKCPLLVDLDPEFETLRKCAVATLDLVEIKKALGDARSELGPIRLLVRALGDKGSEDAATSAGYSIRSILADAEVTVKALEASVADADKDYAHLCRYVSHEPAPTDSTTVIFANIQIFLRDLKKAAEAGVCRRKAEEKAARAKDAKASPTKTATPGKKSPHGNPQLARDGSPAPTGASTPSPVHPHTSSSSSTRPTPLADTSATVEDLMPADSVAPTPIAGDFHVDAAIARKQSMAVRRATISSHNSPAAGSSSSSSSLPPSGRPSRGVSLLPDDDDIEEEEEDGDGEEEDGEEEDGEEEDVVEELLPRSSVRSPDGARSLLAMSPPAADGSPMQGRSGGRGGGAPGLQRVDVVLSPPPSGRHSAADQLPDSPGSAHTAPAMGRAYSAPDSTMSEAAALGNISPTPGSGPHRPGARVRRASKMEKLAMRMQESDAPDRTRYAIGSLGFGQLSSEEQSRVSATIEDSMRFFVMTRVRSESTEARMPSSATSASVHRALSSPE